MIDPGLSYISNDDEMQLVQHLQDFFTKEAVRIFNTCNGFDRAPAAIAVAVNPQTMDLNDLKYILASESYATAVNQLERNGLAPPVARHAGKMALVMPDSPMNKMLNSAIDGHHKVVALVTMNEAWRVVRKELSSSVIPSESADRIESFIVSILGVTQHAVLLGDIVQADDGRRVISTPTLNPVQQISNALQVNEMMAARDAPMH